MKPFEKVADFPVPNVAAALVSPDGVRTLGEVDRRFEVASVTKPVVAYAVMVAVEEGAVELDQPAGPEGSTLRHLLAHASGVGFDSREPQKGVGERRIYSSAGYEWAAETVEGATGIKFPEYLHQAVFEPLGMNSSALEGSAGHGLRTTVSDLVAFAKEVQNPQLLHPSTVAEMRTLQFPGLRGIVPGYGNFKDCAWGLGFEIRAGKDHWMGELPAETVGHFGMTGTYLWIAPDDTHAMVMLSDKDFGDWAKPLWAETNTAIWQALG
ncbi:beta-lactamase [Corynebacterium phocae]|uniref:Beta-lactamase n=1 Tax=Corynebacterium phocae TaxID=161895 RepID=A0A1L7D1X1_9CORY|nr:serine hydrolase domain-containing protein [Corynebacterium phocae]APT92145.1 beta-lactamase [Corynebacterium phocae]KAA8725929.1 beta-lactamase family protein [Corynebacterium phocae]